MSIRSARHLMRQKAPICLVRRLRATGRIFAAGCTARPSQLRAERVLGDGLRGENRQFEQREKNTLHPAP